SKTFCPFCVKVKQLLDQLGIRYKAIELNFQSDGPDMQAALAEWTGQRTVPNVFIGGKHIGGCDGTSLTLSFSCVNLQQNYISLPFLSDVHTEKTSDFIFD
ncbi:hypothetical protein GW17_00012820, partial [Ensete ventricosum]